MISKAVYSSKPLCQPIPVNTPSHLPPAHKGPLSLNTADFQVRRDERTRTVIDPVQGKLAPVETVLSAFPGPCFKAGDDLITGFTPTSTLCWEKAADSALSSDLGWGMENQVVSPVGVHHVVSVLIT
ncbi:hypothetical protein ACOMHN_013610 [Nucella lapillus]